MEAIQKKLLEKTGKLVEVMVYGDGAFKDPVGRIWELADPVVSPAYTSGLEGTPNELKLPPPSLPARISHPIPGG